MLGRVERLGGGREEGEVRGRLRRKNQRKGFIRLLGLFIGDLTSLLSYDDEEMLMIRYVFKGGFWKCGIGVLVILSFESEIYFGPKTIIYKQPLLKIFDN